MKIETTIKTLIIKGDKSVTLERTTVSTHGDNPAFERGETVGAVQVAISEFIDRNALGGTRPL